MKDPKVRKILKEERQYMKKWFKNMDKQTKSAEKQVKHCQKCGRILTDEITTDLKSKWCDSCYYFD